MQSLAQIRARRSRQQYPGGEVTLQGLGGLGQLTAESSEELAGVLGQLDVLEQLVTDEIADAVARGDDTVAIEQQHAAVVDNLIDLFVRYDSMSEADIPEWQADAAALFEVMDAMLSELSGARLAAEGSTKMSGVLIGAGAVAAFMVLGLIVWGTAK